MYKVNDVYYNHLSLDTSDAVKVQQDENMAINEKKLEARRALRRQHIAEQKALDDAKRAAAHQLAEEEKEKEMLLEIERKLKAEEERKFNDMLSQMLLSESDPVRKERIQELLKKQSGGGGGTGGVSVEVNGSNKSVGVKVIEKTKKKSEKIKQSSDEDADEEDEEEEDEDEDGSSESSSQGSSKSKSTSRSSKKLPTIQPGTAATIATAGGTGSSTGGSGGGSTSAAPTQGQGIGRTELQTRKDVRNSYSSVETWNKAISNTYLTFTENDTTVERVGSVSSYPAAFADLPSDTSVFTVIIDTTNNNTNWLTFGLTTRGKLADASSDGVGRQVNRVEYNW